MYIVLAILFTGIMMVCMFILGGVYTKNVMLDALDEARQQRTNEEYYRLAGYKQAGDPKPYVPPTVRPKTPRPRNIPHTQQILPATPQCTGRKEAGGTTAADTGR